MNASRNEIFFSYSHTDEKWKDRLLTTLAPLVDQREISIWHDRKIRPGFNWQDEIALALSRARVAVLLVSPEFLASPFIRDTEMPLILEAASNDGLAICWVAIRCCLYDETQLRDCQAVNNPKQPIASIPRNRRDSELVRISKAIKNLFLDPSGSVPPSRVSEPQDDSITPSALPLTKTAVGIRCGTVGISAASQIAFSVSERCEGGALRRPSFSYRAWPPAMARSSPRVMPAHSSDEFKKEVGEIALGPIKVVEAAEILRPRDVWRGSSIGWAEIGGWDLHPFWERGQQTFKRSRVFGPGDKVRGKHVRLASAGVARDAHVHEVYFTWQRISWEQSWNTNHVINDDFDGVPAKCWFDERDLILPPLDSDIDYYDPPLANRLAINLAVILKAPDRELTVFQFRPRRKTNFSNIVEAGVSESVHGDQEWLPHEQDIVDGHPDLIRTARRCLWQELGIAEAGSLDCPIPCFDIDIRFTAIILNRRELSPRVTGYAIVRGTVEDFRIANQESVKRPVRHKDFMTRITTGDAVLWENLRLLDASPQSLAGILMPSRAANNGILSPECRVRLLYFLEHTLGRDRASKELQEHCRRAKRPDWWPS